MCVCGGGGGGEEYGKNYWCVHTCVCMAMSILIMHMVLEEEETHSLPYSYTTHVLFPFSEVQMIVLANIATMSAERPVS